MAPFTRASLLAAALMLGGCAANVGDVAPDWTLVDTGGVPHTLSDHGGQVRVLEFWATWCGPCHAVSPHIQELHERFADDGVMVFAIHFDDTGDPAAYLRERGFTYTALLDGNEVARAYGVSKIPTILVLDRQGAVVHRQTGFRAGDEDVLDAVVRASL